MTVKETIPIVFHAGCYGTYLEWALTTLTTEHKILPPFTNKGNSHKFKGNHLIDMDGWRNFVTQPSTHQFVRLHPKTKQDQSLSDNLDTIASAVDGMIYLYPTRQAKLLVVNNYISKVYDNWWLTQFSKTIESTVIYDKWPVDRSTSINDVPVWIKREFLSLYLIPAWEDQVEWNNPVGWQNSKSLNVSVTDLLCDFKSTLQKIQQYFKLSFTKDISQIIPIHTAMLRLQEHLDQDIICQQIIEAVLDSIDYNWNTLPLASESWIQWQLRNLKYEIKCDGLDIFPTNSLKLRNLLYPI